MLRPRWKKVISDLWDNKVRTILVVASIAVGVFSVGMIAGAYMIISNDMSASYASGNPANISLWTDGFDENAVKTIRNIPDVKESDGRRVVNVRVQDKDGNWISLDLLAINDFEEMQINRLVSLDGRSIPDEQQLLLEHNAQDEMGAELGDMVSVQLPDGTIKTLEVVGIVLDMTTSAGDFLAAPLGYMNLDTLEWLGQPKNYNRLFATVEQEPNNITYIQEVSTQIADKLEKGGTPVYRTQLSKTDEHPMASTVQAILGILGALGVLIVFLSSSLIANTLNALLNQHLHYIGVMKLIGARRITIFSMYIVLILSFGFIALVIAIPLGGQAAYALSNLVAEQMNFLLTGYRLVPLAIILQVVIALVVPLAAGFIPVNNGSRIKVQSAISGVNPAQNLSGGYLDRLGRRLHWLSRPMLLSLRNTFRRKGRLALTLLTLTMGGAIFIAVFNVQASLDQYIANIGNYFLADVSINFDQPYRINEVIKTAQEVPGVNQVEGWAYLSTELLNPDGTIAENLQILAPPAESNLIEPMLVDGRWLLPGDTKALAISEAILETYPGLKAGDLLPLKVNGHEEQWEVVGLFKFVGVDNLLAYATYEYISEQLNMANQAFSYRIVADEHSLDYQKNLSDELDKHFRLLGFKVNEVEAGLSTLETASEALGILISFLLIMALLTAIVGSIGLTGTMGINVLERTREIGVMRAIGAIDRMVILTVIMEGLIIGMMSWFFAAILAFPISLLLSRIISQAIFNSPIDLAFSVQGFIIWLGVVIILSSLASILPARNAARLTIREVLAYE